jgi:two-component system nitrate/nitrite response regulator NarL
MKDVTRVSVVDKHPLFRDGIILALSSQPDIEVVGSGASAEDAIRIAQDAMPNVAVIDTGTLGRNMATVETILAQNSRIGILFLAFAAIS